MAGFKARARALDMLGRQQIAGIPTAISELFKNAHDAYADNVIVDYFRSDKLFVLRDDGYGMTRKDFEDKWLTLGTESKFVSSNDDSLPEIPSDSVRPIMGEKGIGRLAIASIGDHVLILTRAVRKDGLHDLVMSFVYWRLFEIPGINLDQVTVPVKEIPEGKLPDEKDFDELRSEVSNNIDMLAAQGYINAAEKDNLKGPLKSLYLSARKIGQFISGPSLADNGHGTWFIISPANEFIEASIDGTIENGSNPSARVTPLKEVLLGFCNTMFLPKDDKPVIRTEFRDHKSDEYYDDLINDRQFWTIDDYLKADQRINGRIDEYGQFKGDVFVYGKVFNDRIINWKDNKGLKTQCGPFNIQFGYIQGNQSDTMLSSEDFALMTSKLDKISGLYIYKDNIRILPYGDSSHDYLKLEERRNKSNSYYFFSYRRMFGAISITKKDNPNLSEKAGREGFRENMAYKQFLSILTNLFIQLAADFFRDATKYYAGPDADYFVKQKELLAKKYKAQKKYEATSKAKKEAFQKSLNETFSKINDEKYLEQIDSILSDLNRGLNYCQSLSDQDAASTRFIQIEQEARNRLNQIIEEYTIKQPRGFQPTKRSMQDYETYLGWYQNASAEVFEPAEKRIDSELSGFQKSLNLNVSRRKRLEVAVDTTISKYQKETKNETTEVQKTIKDISAKVISVSNGYLAEYEAKIRQVQNELSRINPYSLDDDSLVQERSRLENDLISSAEGINQKIANIRRQLDAITLNGDTSNLDALDLYAEEVETLKAQLNADLELSQLGLAVSAIQHEFQHTVDNLKLQIRKFKAWADINDGLKNIYTSFRVNFEHLDGYLGLFAPLNRRLYREAVEIYGNDSYKFVKDVFYNRISEERHNISLECSLLFSKNKIKGYPSTFYPVYINIVDNAIFWLKDTTIDRKVIYMDADSDGTVYISNNGPSIDIRDWERIFENGYTRKPSGRGMGLYLSKEVLNKAGYDICVIEPHKGFNVTFKIFKLSE